LSLGAAAVSPRAPRRFRIAVHRQMKCGTVCTDAVSRWAIVRRIPSCGTTS
jgi:hypothetical protein